MTFHSLDFVAFFLVVVAIYWRLGVRAQNVFLLVASYVFYAWVHPWFIFLILFSTSVDWLSALAMERWPGRKRAFLWLSVVSNLGLLGFFKYFNFFLDNLNALLGRLGAAPASPALTIFLPVGISFYTFKALSYTIDVYRGELRARRSFVDVALFVSFFSQLVAGPIERAANLLPQVEERRRFSPAAARDALVLMAWGFFKKLVVADNVGVVANKVFALQDPAFPVLWAGVFAYGVQIYADFSAYSDIARGTARWLGFELMINFNHPYLARGPAEFWRRWHISLSTWFRDYVYIPLGGSRVGRLRWACNILATFGLSGFWHGASWNFVLWGLYHGVLLLAERALEGLGVLGRLKSPVLTMARVAVTFALVHVGWLMFRETEIGALLRDLRMSPAHATPGDWDVARYLVLLTATYAVPLWVESLWAEWRRRAGAGIWLGGTAPWTARDLAAKAALAGALVAALLVLRSRTSLDFIYFQF